MTPIRLHLITYLFRPALRTTELGRDHNSSTAMRDCVFDPSPSTSVTRSMGRVRLEKT